MILTSVSQSRAGQLRKEGQEQRSLTAYNASFLLNSNTQSEQAIL
jgi:hypothetical protein